MKARRIRKRGKMVVEEFGTQKGFMSGEKKGDNQGAEGGDTG